MEADFIGVGDVDPDHYTFGFKQIIGPVLAAVTAAVGLFLFFPKIEYGRMSINIEYAYHG